jgi:hypothetical protein
MSATITSVAAPQPPRHSRDDAVVSLNDRLSQVHGIEKRPADDKERRQEETDVPLGADPALPFVALARELPRHHRMSGGIHAPLISSALPVEADVAVPLGEPVPVDASHGEMPSDRRSQKSVTLATAVRGSGHAFDPAAPAVEGERELHGVAKVEAPVRSQGERALQIAPVRESAANGPVLHVDNASEAPMTSAAPADEGMAIGAAGHRKEVSGFSTDPLVAETALPDGQPLTAGLQRMAPADTHPRSHTAEAPPSFLQADTQVAARAATAGGGAKASGTELTYRFETWGGGHAVKAQLAAQGVVTLNPSSTRVNAALTQTKADSQAGFAWRIEAADSIGDDDSARKRRR